MVSGRQLMTASPTASCAPARLKSEPQGSGELVGSATPRKDLSGPHATIERCSAARDAYGAELVRGD